MPRYLLDANLSPRVARFLARRFQFDIVSLQGQRLGELPDHEVVSLARHEGRVIITMDRDFSNYFLTSSRPTVGIIYLDIPNRLRYISEINRILNDFFRHDAKNIDLEHSLVIVSEDSVVIHTSSSG
jgi:predicted nuclease of predicted toxin-antitoxin system